MRDVECVSGDNGIKSQQMPKNDVNWLQKPRQRERRESILAVREQSFPSRLNYRQTASNPVERGVFKTSSQNYALVVGGIYRGLVVATAHNLLHTNMSNPSAKPWHLIIIGLLGKFRTDMLSVCASLVGKQQKTWTGFSVVVWLSQLNFLVK